MIEYESKFVFPDTKTEIEIKIKTECHNQEEKEKTLSFVAQSSHKFYLQIANEIKSSDSSLKDISTKELVDELLTREGVEHKWVEPYDDETISANGPALLISIID